MESLGLGLLLEPPSSRSVPRFMRIVRRELGHVNAVTETSS
jgi:hypothetical protein